MRQTILETKLHNTALKGEYRKFLNIFFCTLYPEILQYYTMILQCPRIIMRYAGFEPETFAPEVWCATNSQHFSDVIRIFIL